MSCFQGTSCGQRIFTCETDEEEKVHEEAGREELGQPLVLQGEVGLHQRVGEHQLGLLVAVEEDLLDHGALVAEDGVEVEYDGEVGVALVGVVHPTTHCRDVFVQLQYLERFSSCG